jgi:hypothetical protein
MFRALCLVGVFLAAACGGDREVDDNTIPTPPSPTHGEGTKGGPIAGTLDVFVRDSVSGDAIADAFVAVTAGTDAQNKTPDSFGFASFADVSGPVTIHVFSTTHVNTTWAGVNAANVTILMDPRFEIVTGIPPTATLQGNVRGVDLIEGTGVKLGTVEAYGRLKRFIPQPQREGSGYKKNVAFQEPGGASAMDYVLAFDPRAKGIMVTGTTFDAPTNLQRIGFASVNAEANETVTQDIELTHALSGEVEVVSDASSPLPRSSVGAFLVLPDDQEIYLLGSKLLSMSGTFKTPPLDGALARAKLFVYGQRESDNGDQFLHAAKAVSVGEREGIAFPEELAVPVRNGRNFQLTPLPGATFHTINVNHLQLGAIWHARIFSGDMLDVPTPPSGFEDLYSGEVLIDIRAHFYKGADPNNAATKDLELADERAYSSRFTNVDL